MSELMTNVDNFWLHLDHPTNLMVIVGVLEFDEPLDFQTVKTTIEKRLLKFERFRKKVVKPASGVGIPTWEIDRNFDIRSHVHRVALPAPGDKAALQEMIGDLTTMPLDRSKPLWQMHFIENYGSGCALVARFHHCIADGIALIYVLLSLTDLTPTGTFLDIKPEKAVKHPPSVQLGPFVENIKAAFTTVRNVGNYVKNEVVESIKNPMRMIELTRVTTGIAVDVAAVLTKLLIMSPDPKTSFKGELGVRKYVAWSEPIALEDIKVIGRAVNATVNDVLISTVSGALRRYLIKRNNRVNELDLRVTIPVNIRRPGEEYQLGNKFSLIFLSLPIHVEDPIMRMREVKRRMDDLKHSPDALIGFQALNTLGLSPSNIAKRAAYFLANKATAVMTNVPGPRQPLYFAGKKLSNMMFWVPRSGQVGHGISIISYDGKVTLGVVTDARLIPDPEAIIQGFYDEFKYVAELANTGKIDKDPLIINDRCREPKANTEQHLPINHTPIFYPSLSDTRIEISKTDAAQTTNDQNTDPDFDSDFESDSEACASDQCQAITKSGRRCKNRSLTGSSYCKLHQNLAENISDAQTRMDA